MEYTKGEWSIKRGFKVTCREEQIEMYEVLKELAERLRTHGVVEVGAFKALAKAEGK